jgi:hypothetical protein
MANSGAVIGGTTLYYDLHWITKYQADTAGQDFVALDGTICTIRPAARTLPRGLHKFRFEWATQSEVNAMKTLFSAPQTFSLKPENGGSTYTCVSVCGEGTFTYKPVVPEDGFTHKSVASTSLDLYNGEFQVYMLP